MSYCRFSEDSEVYMYSHTNGYIICAFCKLRGGPEEDDPKFKTRGGAIKHLQNHRQEGHKFSELALWLLADEIDEFGNEVEK